MGNTGRHRTKGGFDLIAQGVSGIMSVTGEPGRLLAKAGIPLTDLGAALFAATGILAAVHHRARAGVGQYIDTSLVEPASRCRCGKRRSIFLGPECPVPPGLADPDDRAVPGDAMR